MNLKRSYFFIAISSLALVIVLGIQVNWIFQSAKIKEELFNERASLVLSKTTEALRADTLMCKKLGVCGSMDATLLVDSLFRHYLKVYAIEINYTFEIETPPSAAASNRAKGFYQSAPASYKQCIDENSTSGPELKLIFPGKEKFILAEMGIPFVSSVLLILVVILLFWRTTFSLLKEKQIADHTRDFLNNMTHEFKTPLTNIALAGKMILKDKNIDQQDKVRHYSGIILDENEKLRDQVEQVLSMTALERGEIPLQKTELDVHCLINDVLKNCQLQVETRMGMLTTKLDAENFIVMGDRSHLANVLYNLIDNAIKYSKEKPELTVTSLNKGQELILSITDKGIGIAKGYQKQIFKTFFRVPTGDVHNVKGFGLGLAYVKKIVELHGGKIAVQSECENEKESGTTFTIGIPYV